MGAGEEVRSGGSVGRRHALVLAVLLLAACRGPRCGPGPSTTPRRPEAAQPTSAPASAPAGAGGALAATPTSAPTGAAASRAGAAVAAGLPLPDRGIFGDLDRRVRLHRPSWLRGGPAVVLQTRSPPARLLLVAGTPVAFAGPAERWPTVTLERLPRARDADGDGIPDVLDLLLGAKKAALNGAAYTEGYRRLPYPGGDVPRQLGVCTDVVVRALRNAGIDLQRRVHQDILRARRAYPMVRRPDANIDHRRVRTLLVYFQRHFRALPPQAGSAGEPLLPGDLVLLNTMGDARPDHLGVLSDQLGPSGKPLVINNWTVGYRTSAMDLLGRVPVTHRFRLPTARLGLSTAQTGLQGLLHRRGLSLPTEARQLLLVQVPLWRSSAGELRRYQRTARGPWKQVGRAVPVRVGSAGLGRGRGLHPAGALAAGPVKREGDRRSPAGLFALGTALGPGPRPYAGPWPYRRTDGRDRLVDDSSSPHYNRWRRAPLEGPEPWRSAERLASYRLALRVLHNPPPVQPGAGSAIFLHLPDQHNAATVGCTSVPAAALTRLLTWLRPASRPLLAQLPGVLLR